jgi:perosamine synthetase
MHEQPIFQSNGLFKGERYPVSERLARRGLYIPSGLTLTEFEIDRVSEAIMQVLS